MRFETVEEVELFFDHEFNINQWIDIQNFLTYDVIPASNGCQSCDRGVVRHWIRRILAEEKASGYVRPAVSSPSD